MDCSQNHARQPISGCTVRARCDIRLNVRIQKHCGVRQDVPVHDRPGAVLTHGPPVLHTTGLSGTGASVAGVDIEVIRINVWCASSHNKGSPDWPV